MEDFQQILALVDNLTIAGVLLFWVLSERAERRELQEELIKRVPTLKEDQRLAQASDESTKPPLP